MTKTSNHHETGRQLQDFAARFRFGPIHPSVIIVGLILCVLIGLRAYKAHTTGILHDEYWTTRDFCDNIQSPMTIYTSTNNHVLNSLSIVFMRKIAGHYDHFIRIHTVLWSALFCLSAGWIIRNTLRSFPLQILTLLAVLLNWFVFDLSYLARGYAMGLGMVFFTIAVYVHYLTKGPREKCHGWPVTILFIVMNFIAMGAMLSCLSIIASLNMCYVILLLMPSTAGDKGTFKKRIAQAGTLIAGSGGSLFLLYCRILPEVRKFSEKFKSEPFFQYMKKILWDPFVKLNAMHPDQNAMNGHIYTATLIFLGICAVVCLILFVRTFKSNRKTPFRLSPSSFILVLTGGVFLTKIIQYQLLGMSLGMPRNSVFWIALLILSSGIIIDHALGSLAKIKPAYYLMQCLCIGIVSVFLYVNRPSLRAVDIRPYDWGKQSAIGPLVRTLKKIDSEETWNVKLDPYADCLSGPISYYRKFGYQVKRVNHDNFHLLVVREHPAKIRTLYLDYDYFLDFHCSMLVNPSAFNDKPVVYQASPLEPAAKQR